MNTFLKTGILLVCSVFISFCVLAQDKIHKKDGKIIDAKVIAVGGKKVTYKRFDDLNGPEHTLLIADIAEIVYQNHTVDFFDTFGEPAGGKKDNDKIKDKPLRDNAGRNIFAITPLAYTVALDGTINDAGIGVSYERLFGRKGRFGLELPFMIAFSSNKDFDNGTVGYAGITQKFTSLYIMPGIKFYPAPCNTKIRYSVGLSFFGIFGSEPLSIYEANSPVYSSGPYNYPAGTQHYSMYGPMISNAINFAAAKHLEMALELSAGIQVSDNRYAAPVETLGLPLPFYQFGFKIGYRY